MSLSRFGRASVASPVSNPTESYDEVRTLIVRAFSPLVAVCAAEEADLLARHKGPYHDFASLLRPYGERISGKVVIRDSVGASRSWDDFGIHIAELGQLTRNATTQPASNELDRLEELLEQRLESQDEHSSEGDGTGATTLYQYYLSRLLQANAISAHEAFLHPTCTVIVITSATPQPIETLRNLYQQTAQGSRTLPPYANSEYLRYYLLVHDEDRDDFAKTSALFDQMKRHFGLHCHLLRLRSAEPSSQDELEPAPTCEWLSPSEELAQNARNRKSIDAEEAPTSHVFSSDASAIRAFLRELVAQSVVPHMEQRIAIWNEQVASRRKGISGRFMSISKRWGGFGGSSRSVTTTGAPASSASGNYDGLQGYYRYDVPEAILARLSAFAFMLRDYKLAASTMELVRSDFANDKAWKYSAGANEICCVASLLNPLLGTNSAKFKLENFDQMLDTAVSSYLNRGAEPKLALRAALLGLELLKVRGKSAAELAAKYGIRAIELGLVSPGSIGHVLLSERVASCFGFQIGAGSNTGLGVRRRKAALWNVMASDEWMKLGMAAYANERLEEARELYAETKYGAAIEQFSEMNVFMEQLGFSIRIKLGQGKRNRGLSGASELMQQEVDDETVEDMAQPEKLDGPGHRRNLSLAGTGSMAADAVAQRSPVRLRADPLGVTEDDDFE
jgi:trafficking protein particle complex subunit 8